MSEKCLECNQDFKNKYALSRHLARHKITQETYFVKHFGAGMCQICGKPTSFRGLGEGFARTCSKSCGHQMMFQRLILDDVKYKQFVEKVSRAVQAEWDSGRKQPNMRIKIRPGPYKEFHLNKLGEQRLTEIFIGH